MTEELKGKSQRVYRRKPADIAEAKFIAGLIDDFVGKSAKQLADNEQHDELYVLLEYKKTWRAIVKDLTAPEQSFESSDPTPVAGASPAADEPKGEEGKSEAAIDPNIGKRLRAPKPS